MKKIKQWIINNKKGIIIGFIFGAIIAPMIALLGLVSTLIEFIRPLLIGPFDLIGYLIPNIEVGPNTYKAPIYRVVLQFVVNGLCYAIIGGFIQSFKKR